MSVCRCGGQRITPSILLCYPSALLLCGRLSLNLAGFNYPGAHGIHVPLPTGCRHMKPYLAFTWMQGIPSQALVLCSKCSYTLNHLPRWKYGLRKGHVELRGSRGKLFLFSLLVSIEKFIVT